VATERRFASRTHVGRVRQINQDAVHCDQGLYLVADGMGGHRGGEVASAVTVQVVAAREPATADELADAIRAANDEVLRQGEHDPELYGMGTTVVAAVPLDGHSYALANVGDSRAYLLRNGELRQITIDHNRVSELLDRGLITAAEARVHPERNIITRALGVEHHLEVDTWVLELAPGDRLLLCSDGLVNEVTDTVIEGILRRLADPEQAADELLRLALDHGGRDNVTLVLVDEPGGDGGWDERVVGPDPLEWEVQPAPPPPPPPPPAVGSRRSPLPRLTLRSVAFATAFTFVIAVAVGLVGVYARGSYHVGFAGDEVTIFRGRPDKVLWFEPTVAEATSLTRADLTPAEVDEVESGHQTASLDAARDYVDGLGSDTGSTTETTVTATTVTATPPTARSTVPTATVPAPVPQQPAAATSTS
jgi:protein phosphatase